MNNLESLEQTYIRLAYECKDKGDLFGYGYYLKQSFLVHCH